MCIRDRIKREGGTLSGKIMKDNKGNPKRTPGFFKNLKGIGWFIKEYNIAQISYNLTDINVSPLHLVFDKTCEQATKKGIRVTGSELIGLVPKKVLIDAGEYFLNKQKRSLGVPESEIFNISEKRLNGGFQKIKPILEKSFLDLLHNSGYPGIKFEKKIDYAKNNLGEKGKKVKENFEYTSDKNFEFLNIDQIKRVNQKQGF